MYFKQQLLVRCFTQKDAPGFDLCYMRSILAKAKSTELGRGGNKTKLCVVKCLLYDNYIRGFVLVGWKQTYEYTMYFQIHCFAL